METDANETVDQIKPLWKSSGDNAETQLQTTLSSSGFNSLDEYRENMVRVYQDATFISLRWKELDEVFDDYYTQASPREASLIKSFNDDVEKSTADET